MKNENIYGNKEKKQVKFSKLYTKDKLQEKRNNSINPILSDKEIKNFNNKITSIYKIETPKNYKRNSMMSNYTSKKRLSFNNNLNFMPLFGRRFSINTNQKNKTNKSINNFNNSINNSNFSSDSSDEEKNLKVIEKEIKNKLKDMTVVMTNKSFIMNNKYRENLDISIGKKALRQKKRRKKNKKVKRKKRSKEEDRKIIKKNLIFDSLDEDENHWDEDNYIFINPESKFIFILDTIIFILSFIYFVYNPLKIANSKCFCINEHIFMTIIMFFIDIVFIFDFFVSFLRAFYNYEYKLIKNPKIIITNYLTGYCFFDFLEALPFDIIIIYLCKNANKYKPDGPFCLYNGINGVYVSIKLCLIIKIMKVLKIMNKKNNKAYKWLIEIDHSFCENFLSVFSFTFLILACTNLFICIHIFIGLQSYPNWLVSMGIQDSTFFEIYITALYGIIETLTTVGYGDVTCDSFTEICFQIILLSVGIVAYSWLITAIGNYVKNETKAEIKHNKDLNLLEEIRVEFKEMSYNLYKKLRQHLKSVANQQKKVDLNILVNSLPYSVKNLVLFKVYDNCIQRFNFFKNIENTDFISRVLTNFIPLFSKRKAILIYEGENIENIVFVESGILTIDVAIDMNAPELSIKRYIYEKFNDIIENDKENNNKQEKTNISVTKENLSQQFDKIDNGFQNIFNHKNSLAGQSYHESYIEQEIGKYNLEGNDDIEERNNKFLHIMYIKRNEHFGITYMFLNKPSPLYLRVKSKKADIFLLRKHDATIISKAYPHIWKLISENAFHNMVAIKNKTFETLDNYCSYNGLILDNKYEPQKSTKLANLNLFEIKELMELEEKKTKKSKGKTLHKKKNIKYKRHLSDTMAFKQKDKILKIKNNLIKLNESQNHVKNSTLTSESTEKLILKLKSFQPSVLIGSIHKKNYEDIKKSKIIEKDSEKNLEQLKHNDSTNIINEEQENTLKISINDSKSEELEFRQKNQEEEHKIKEKDEGENQSEEREENNKSDSNLSDLEKTNIIYNTDNEISYPNTLNNLPPTFASFLKSRVIKKKIKDKKYYKLMCLKLIESFNNFINNTSNNIKNDIENTNNNTTSINNYNISNIKDINNYNSNINFFISDEVNKNLDIISSFSKHEISGFFDKDRLAISKNDSFEIKSIYNNLNIISKGKYGKNKTMQKETEEFVLYYTKDINGNKFLNFKNNTKLNLSNVKKERNSENSFSMLIGNLSEIKSNNSINIQIQNSPINNYKNIDSNKTPSSKSKKSLDCTNIQKKSENKNPKDAFSSNILELDNFNLNQSPICTSQQNISENSENKIIKNDKINASKNKDNVINFGDIKPKIFIKKIFTKKKNKKEKKIDNKKENKDKSQSKEFLNKVNILNPENGLRINRNLEVLKNRTLDKLKNVDERKESKATIEENKNYLTEVVDNKNCNIY